MKIGKTLYATNRKAWRSWLAEHHKNEKEIWLVYFKKNSTRKSVAFPIYVYIPAVK